MPELEKRIVEKLVTCLTICAKSYVQWHIWTGLQYLFSCRGALNSSIVHPYQEIMRQGEFGYFLDTTKLEFPEVMRCINLIADLAHFGESFVHCMRFSWTTCLPVDRRNMFLLSHLPACRKSFHPYEEWETMKHVSSKDMLFWKFGGIIFWRGLTSAGANCRAMLVMQIMFVLMSRLWATQALPSQNTLSISGDLGYSVLVWKSRPVSVICDKLGRALANDLLDEDEVVLERISLFPISAIDMEGMHYYQIVEWFVHLRSHKLQIAFKSDTST